jgi:hypothetical protein
MRLPELCCMVQAETAAMRITSPLHDSLHASTIDVLHVTVADACVLQEPIRRSCPVHCPALSGLVPS